MSIKIQIKADRLRRARERAGYSSASEAARAFGWPDSGYRHHENGTRGYGPDAATKYGKAFRVKPGWLLGMDGIDDAVPTDFKASEKLLVHGSVEAGAWREPDSDESVYELDIPAPLPNVKRFGLMVNGRSMDEFYQPGTVLDCVSIFTNGVAPRSGDHVIVERIRPDGLREMTVKEFVEAEGKFLLRPRSSDPHHKEDIEIGSPDAGHVGDDEIRVVGFVVSAILPPALRLLFRMKKAKHLGWSAQNLIISDT